MLTQNHNVFLNLTIRDHTNKVRYTCCWCICHFGSHGHLIYSVGRYDDLSGASYVASECAVEKQTKHVCVDRV